VTKYRESEDIGNVITFIGPHAGGLVIDVGLKKVVECPEHGPECQHVLSVPDVCYSVEEAVARGWLIEDEKGGWIEL